MKKKLTKVLFPIFLSVVCGAVCGRLVYSIYDKKISEDISMKKIYLLQAGAYSTYDNMVNSMLLSNYVYYEDDGLYKLIIGVTEDCNNIEKIKNTYDGSVIISEYYLDEKDLSKKIKEYDQKIKQTSDNKEIKKLVSEMLAIYKDKKTTLIEIKS